MFDETVLFAQTYGADGSELIIDSRESHDGASLVLPFTPEGTIGLSVNPGSGQLTADAPELFVTVTASLTDYYQYYIDNGLLALNADGATIVNVCDGVDQNSDGTGVCFSDDNGNFLFDNTEEHLSAKFKKFDLIGVPYQIILGNKSNNDKLEFKEINGKTENLSLDEVINKLQKNRISN